MGAASRRLPALIFVEIIERFVLGKAPDPALCEDAIVVTSGHAAVIDGATDVRGRRYGEASGGWWAMAACRDAIEKLPYGVDAHSAVAAMTSSLAARIPAGLSAAERPSASVTIYSAAHREVWQIGDVGFAYRGLPASIGQPRKLVDRVATAFRVAVLAASEAAASERAASERAASERAASERAASERAASARAASAQAASARAASAQAASARAASARAASARAASGDVGVEADPGRLAARALIERQGAFRNTIGPYGYGGVDGRPVPAPLVVVHPLPPDVDELVIASDGYPVLGATLAESESVLAGLLAKDPRCVAELAGTKGVLPGNVSFDDRAYLRLRVTCTSRTRTTEP